MIREYVPLLMLTIFVIANAIGMLLVSHLFPGARPTPVKGTPYESGITPLGSTRERFSVKFYLVAMLFVVFDIETVFLFPWAKVFRELGFFGLVEMGIFILILGLGLIYVWKRGALEWE